MYCFRDFPLSRLAAHMMKCNDGLSGPKERFANFIPSVHEVCANRITVSLVMLLVFCCTA